MTTKSELVGLIEQKEAIEQKIEAAQTELGLDAKGVKALRKAIAAKEAAEKTLAAMMGIDPATGALVGGEDTQAAATTED